MSAVRRKATVRPSEGEVDIGRTCRTKSITTFCKMGGALLTSDSEDVVGVGRWEDKTAPNPLTCTRDHICCVLFGQHVLDEGTDPWGVQVERVEM